MLTALLILILGWIEADARATVDFDTQVLPALTKHGCNAGACHGAAAGRGQFNLSLFGSDADRDYEAIVHEYAGRRLRFSDPESSLLLTKPSGRVAHGGDEIFDPDSETAGLLLAWIEQGAPRGGSMKIDRLDVLASPVILEGGSTGYRLKATARMADGSVRDVSDTTLFTIDPSSGLGWDAERRFAVPERAGRHRILARYMNRVTSVEMIKPYAQNGVASERNAGQESSALASPGDLTQRIDAAIAIQLAAAGVTPAPRVTDLQWLRRICLDMTGRLPTLEQIQAFESEFQSAPEGIRARWIEALMRNDAFVDAWSWRWARWLQLKVNPTETKAYEAYVAWIREGVASDRSVRDMGGELLTSSGDSHDVGPANFARTATDPRTHAELIGSVFLGTRLQCAQCHDHPMDRWTMDDYHGLAAIFAGVDRGRHVVLTGRGQVIHPRTKRPAVPRIPGAWDVHGTERGFKQFSRWAIAGENPTWARVMVNRLWHAMMGRGLVDPVDDFRETNPASHPELLDDLATEFRASGYRIRPILAAIAMSDAYARGRDARLSDVDASFYAQCIERPLAPELLVDAIHDCLGTTAIEDSLNGATRAVHLLDASAPQPTLDILGRCVRGNACADGAQSFGFSQQLHWLNGTALNQPLESKNTFFSQAIDLGVPNETIVTEGYLRAFSRYPTANELDTWTDQIPLARDPRLQWYQDWMWSLMSSPEFLTHH